MTQTINSRNHPQGRDFVVEFKGPMFGFVFMNGNADVTGFSD